MNEGEEQTMSENCDHNCEGCAQTCEDRESAPDLKAHLNMESRVGKVIGVVSGKGGVGKSLVTSLLAVSANRLGLRTAILDADITGPSIPRSFGIKGRAQSDGIHMLPIISRGGIQIVSVNMLLQNDSDPVFWRGPLLSNMVKQFWSDVLWDDVDVMFIDMPPGTGDVPLTVFQSLPVDGIVIVASPQELVGMIVEKAVNMARMMNIPVLALVENMSYAACPDCGKQIYLFGESHIDSIAQRHHIETIIKLPIDPRLSQACDAGVIELFEGSWLDGLLDGLLESKEKES